MAFSRPIGFVALLLALAFIWLAAGVASLLVGRLDMSAASAGELALVAGWPGPLLAALAMYRHRRSDGAAARRQA